MFPCFATLLCLILWCFHCVHLENFQFDKLSDDLSQTSSKSSHERAKLPKHQRNGAPYIDITSSASRLAEEFQKMARDELGTMTMQAAFDRLEYEPMPENSLQADLDALVDQLSLRLRHYGHLVSNPKSLVTQLYREHKKSPLNPRFDCCNLSERDLRYEALYGTRVSRLKCCDLIPFDLPVSAFNPGHNLTQRFRRQLEYWPNVKWLYFITADGLHTEFPAHNFRAATVASLAVASTASSASSSKGGSFGNWVPRLLWPSSDGQNQRSRRHLPSSLLNTLYDCRLVHQLRHRDVFVRSVVTKPIWMVIVLDQSEVSSTRMLLGQQVARLLVASLSEKDRVGLVLATDGTRVPRPHAGPTSQHLDLYPATHETKLFLGEHIYGLRSSRITKTNHTRALLEAFRIIRHATESQLRGGPEADALGPPTDNLMIAYISRGSLDDLEEQNATMLQVTAQQALLRNRVIINTYMPVEEKSATVLFEKTFMSHLATRWNVHSEPNHLPPSDVRPGHFYTINRTTDLGETVGRFYNVWTGGGEANLRPAKTSSSLHTPSSKSQTTSPTASSKLFFSLPYRDLEGRGLVMSISQAFYDEATFLGVMGVDLHVADLFDQVVHFGGNPPSGFVFVVDAETGLSVYHPAALRELLTSFHPHPTPPILPTKSVHDDDVGGGGPIFATPRVADGPPSIGEPILHADVRQLERVPGFGTRVLPRILRGEVNGTAELLVEIDRSKFALIAATGIWSADEGSPVSEVDGSPGHSRGNTVRVKVTYRWRRITDPATQFAVVMRSFEVENSTPSRQLLELTPPFESCYHRLDLFKRDQACLYLRQLATFSYNTVYLPPRTFMRPFEHLTSAGGAETADQVRHMVAYLTDQTSLISNPGLVAAPPGARTAVAVVERIGKFWRQRGGAGGASKFGKHIIRRYVSTDTGIMLMWPGTLMPTNYDATTRLWYLRAVQNAGRLVFTGPYLDDGGAGSIVTISYAIFEGNQSGVHTPGIGRVQAVIAMDVPHRLFDHLLATWLPAWCTPRRPRRGGGKRARNDSKTPGLPISSLGSASTRSSRILLDILRDRGMLVEGNSEGEEEGDAIEAESRDPTKCILMDDRGYLIAHPGLTEPKIAGPLESGHINHREPMVAADLLNHVDFVKKMSCVSHTHRSLQRFYVFNTSHTEVVTNFAHGEDCNRYQLALVPGTNVFFGVIRDVLKHRRRNDKAAPSCRAAFCSCSTKDRRCLSCGRMEQRECECPCECPVSVGVGLVSSSPSSNTTATTSEALPVCVPLNLQAPLLPMPKAATAASWKALASLPDAPPLCQQSGSLSHRVPVASLHEWLLLFNASANESLPKNFDSGGSLVPAWGPVDCGTIGRRVIECVATIGCEFCSLRSDGQALENGGFCAPMDVCFGGVVGAVSPYSSVTTVPLSFFPSAPTSLEENWPFLFPPPPSLLPPGHYRHLPPKTSSSAAQFYHYYYYHHHHHYYHGSSAAAAAAENLYVSPYALARHYFPGSLSSVGEVSDGSMAGWSNSISSPVGPVAGAVMAIFIVVILGVYCLRHQTANRLRPAAPDDALLSAGTTNAAPGLEVGRDGGPEGQGNNSSQSGNGGFGRARSSENPPNDATDNDKPPPAAGAVAITTKATGSSSGGCGGDGRGTSVSGDTDSESELGGRHRSALPAPAEARTTGATTGGAAAIIIEGVGVFVKSNVFLDDDDDDEDDVAEAEEVRSLALAEFVSDPTAVSPYRVTTSTAVSAKRPTLDDTVTTASSSAATTTDNGYVSNERPSSSCAESSSIPDSERQNAVVKGGGVAADAHSPTRDPDYVAGVGGVGGAGSEAWVGTLILGPGMDDVMCAEEMEHQLLLSKKRGHRQRSRLLPSSSSAHHYQYHVRPTASGAGGLTRLPVIVHSRPQPPPLVALVPLADETASSGTTTTTPVATVCRWSPRDNIV